MEYEKLDVNYIEFISIYLKNGKSISFKDPCNIIELPISIFDKSFAFAVINSSCYKPGYHIIKNLKALYNLIAI